MNAPKRGRRMWITKDGGGSTMYEVWFSKPIWCPADDLWAADDGGYGNGAMEFCGHNFEIAAGSALPDRLKAGGAKAITTIYLHFGG